MHKAITTKDAPPSFSRYSPAVEVAGGKRWLYISGQVGITPDGELAEGAEAQHRQTWRNILALLRAAGMGPEHLVKVTTLVTSSDQIAVSRAARDEALGPVPVPPAATLMVVAGLASPEWKVEIEVIAAG